MIKIRGPLVRMMSIILVVSFLIAPVTAVAQSYDPDEDLPTPTSVQKSVEKLGRGFSNILFGWSEIPFTWDKKMKEGKSLSYLLTVAPLLGGTRAVVRMGVGIYEVNTFFWSPETVDYESLIEPDYIF